MRFFQCFTHSWKAAEEDSQQFRIRLAICAIRKHQGGEWRRYRCGIKPTPTRPVEEDVEENLGRQHGSFCFGEMEVPKKKEKFAILCSWKFVAILCCLEICLSLPHNLGERSNFERQVSLQHLRAYLAGHEIFGPFMPCISSSRCCAWCFRINLEGICLGAKSVPPMLINAVILKTEQPS